MANDTSESVPTNGTTPAQALADVLSILAENLMASSNDDTKGPLGKKDLKKRMQRLLSTATVRPFCGEPRSLSAANRRKGITFPPSPQASPKERLALLTLQYQFMQFDIVVIRARIETMEVIFKCYRALVIHHHWVCANHEENVKEKHRIDIERQKAKIRELASSQGMVQSTHFDQHADDVKGKRDAIAATYISHRSPTATSANHRKERQNQFEQFLHYAPQCCLLVPKSCPACTSSSSTPVAETEEQRLDVFKSLLESTTYHSTLTSNDANSSQDTIRRNAELLHEGLKLLIMLTYPTELWQPFRNATKLRNRALQRLRDLKATEDFMAVQLQCRFRYLKRFKTIVDGLANKNKKKKSSKPAKPVNMDARVRERIEMDEFVASFDRQKLEALRVFWAETQELGTRDRKRRVRKVVVGNRTLPGGYWEEGEDPFWAQVKRLRELLQIVKSESDGEVGVRRAGRSLGAKVLEHAVERCRFDWRRELAGVGTEVSDGDEDEDDEWEDVDEWREMEEGDGEVDGEVEGEEMGGEPEIVGKGKGKENEDPHPKL